jgi:hypothetical protein
VDSERANGTAKSEGHQPRLREVAWVLLELLNPVRQALFPAHTMGLLIRMAERMTAPLRRM